MPNPIHPKIKDAYENIKKITGLEFDEENLEEVQRALGQIYINGHDLFISSRLEAIRTNNDATVMAVSNMLTNILEGSKDERGFISIMNPNDPYAVPKVLYQNNEYDEAGRAYERDFREKHRKKIAALDKEMDNFVMPKSDHLKASDYFTADQFNRRTGRFRRQSDIWEFNRTEPAVQLCNLILLGRGYTMEDLLSDKEEVAEAKQNVGAELTKIMHEGLDLSERSRRFQELVKDSMDFLNNYTFRPVDLSDDTTLENVKYNQWVANMADNLGEVLKGAGQTFKSQWIADTGKRVDQIRNFAGGIAALDRVRLKGVDGKLRTPERMREPVLAQVLIEKAGMSYTKYHRSHFKAAAGEVDLRNELSETLKDHINGNAEYAQALRRGRETELYKDVFKQITERDLARQENNPVLKLAEEMDRIEQTGIEDVRANGRIYSWFDSTPERNYTEYGKELQHNFTGGKVAQLSRPYTIEALVMAYGCWKAERNHEQVSIKDFHENAELQKATGVEAIEYLLKHPIPAATEKQTIENTRIFSDLIAALNRKLADTELPKIDYRNSQEIEANRAYLQKLNTLLCDSHQLRDVVPEDRMDIFYEAQGGRKAYQKVQEQITAAEALCASICRQIRGVENRSLDSLFAPDKADSACRGIYILRHGGEELLGRKIGEYPEDVAESGMWLTMYSANSFMKDEFSAKATQEEYKKGIREYLSSCGEKDTVGIEATIESARLISMEILKMTREAEEKEEEKEEKKEEKKPEESQKQEAQEELSDDSVVEMGDPGDNVEDLARDSGEQIHAAAQEEEVPLKQEAQEELQQMQEEGAALTGAYDWSGELSPAQWKERLTKFYKEVDDHDPAWIRSSGEYRDVKHNLKKALDMLEDGSYSREAFNSRMEKAFRRAGDYIDKKNNGSIGKHYGKERLTTITELRELLAGRNRNPLDVKGVADLFGQKITRSVKGEEKIVEDTASQQEKLERGMKRLGIYLASAEDDNPEKVKGKMELVERVIAERGKNPETRSRLMDEMAKIRPAGDTAELMKQAMDRITDRMLSQKGLDRQAAGWGKVLKALQTTVQNSQDPAMKSAVNENVVKNYLRISNFAEKAQQVQNKILDSDNVKTLSQQEAGVIVAAATFSSLMKSTDENAVPCINYLFRNKTDKEILDYFVASADSRALQKLTDNESLKMQATEGIKLEMTGKAGASNLCRALAGHMQGGQEPVREQQMQKATAMQAR